MNYSEPGLRDRLAGEYVLGTLHGRARARFERAAAGDAALAAAVAAWQRRAARLAGALAPRSPPAALRARILARIGTRRQHRRMEWLAIAAGLLLAIGIAYEVLLPPTAPATTAALTDARAVPGFEVRVAAHGVLVARVRTPQPIATDRAFELWLLPTSGMPVSLGLMPRRGEARLPIADALRPRLVAGAALAVSLEPAGGSRTGLPTGPVLYQGVLKASG